MRIAFFLSTLGGSPLQVGLERGLRALGHEVEPYRAGAAFDLILIFNQTAHATNYVYPDFPTDTVPVAFIDCGEYGYHTRLPDRAHRFANAFAPGALAHDTKNRHEQMRLLQFLQGRSFPYLLREFSKCVTYPSGYFPVDYPLYALSTCNTCPDRETYLRRPLDLFCSWGASHPFRLNITDALRRYPCQPIIRVLQDDVVPRMPQHEYFALTEGAKCSVSYDGYGSSSFRATEVLVRTLLLQGPLSIVTRAPLVDGETCVMYDVTSDGEQFVSTNVFDKLHEALADPERSFAIYQRGHDWCNTHLTETATAQYVLDVCLLHDWSRPTELNVGA